VENFAQGLCGEESLLDSIPCVISETKFMVFMNEMSVQQFSKNTLLNLVGTASACQEIIFIVSRSENVSQNYQAFKRMFDVIEAKRMTKDQIAPLVETS
jgi:hypothetical protein